MRHGAKEEIAGRVAASVAKSESVGKRICGLYYLESYCQQLVTGRVNGAVEPEVSKPKEATIFVDAGFGFAQPAFAKGLPYAVRRAHTFGIWALSVGHAHTCTSLGYFTEQIARAGVIGMGFTNASHIVAAPGGKTRNIGKNYHVAAGETIPEGWAMDKDGHPTTDPEAALQGSLVSMGGSRARVLA